jgi:hypothetical protein
LPFMEDLSTGVYHEQDESKSHLTYWQVLMFIPNSDIRRSQFGHTYIFFQRRNSSQWARASSLSRLHDHTQTHHTR